MKHNKNIHSRLNTFKQGRHSLALSTLLLTCLVNVAEAAVTVGNQTSASTTGLSADDTVNVNGHVNVNSGSNYGLRVDANTHVLTLNVNASGKVTADNVTTGVSILGDGSSNINDLTMTNDGTISATRTSSSVLDATSRGMQTDNIINSTITNNGTISASATANGSSNSAEAYGINVVSDMENSNIINNGTITADARSTNGTAKAYGIFVSNNFHTGSTIQNNGTITATINGIADKEAYIFDTPTESGAPSITNAVSGKLNGNINFNNAFNNSGTLSLPYNANNAYISDFTNNATGILEIGLNTASDGDTTNKYSKLGTSNATFNDGSTIKVNVLTASNNQTLLIGKSLNDVVTASNALNINGTLNITDNSALLNFEYIKDGNNIDLNIIEGTSLIESVKAGGGNNSTQAVASILGSENSLFDGVISKLNEFSTDAQVAKAVASTTQQIAPATIDTSSQIMSSMQNIVDRRQNFDIGLNSGDSLMSDKNVWFKPYYSSGTQKDKNNINGFGVKTRGFGIGVDGEYDLNKKLGLAFFYSQADVNIKNTSQSADLDVFSALVYGNIPVIDNKTNLLYQLAYARQENSTIRNIFNGEIATADYTTTSASADVKLVRNYQINDKLIIQPLVGLTYRKSNNPSYSESGAGVLNLQVNSFTKTESIGTIGTQAKYKINDKSSIITNLQLGYDFNDKVTSITSSFEGSKGATFDTNGIDNGRLNYQASLGYEIKNVLGGELNLMYDYQAKGSSFNNNTFSAKYVQKF